MLVLSDQTNLEAGMYFFFQMSVRKHGYMARSTTKQNNNYTNNHQFANECYLVKPEDEDIPMWNLKFSLAKS